MKKLFALLALLFVSTTAMAQVELSDRHIYFIYPAVEEVKGNYIFLVRNSGKEEARQTLKILLPVETIDWAPQDGIGPDELKPGKDGGLILEKNFPPGETMISLAFIVPAKGDKAVMTFKPDYNVGELAVLSRKGEAELSGSEGVQPQSGISFAGQMYDSVGKGAITAGETVSITIGGIPQGRTRLKYLGFAAIAIIVVTAGVLTMRTKPRRDQAAAEWLA